MADSVRHLAFELSRSSLTEQEKRLSDLRSRAGTVLASASIAGSFLASRHGDIGTSAVLAIAFYVLCVAATVYVVEMEAQRGGGIEAAYEAVTEWLETFHEDNRAKLETLGRCYAASCAALTAEVVLWTLSVTGTL